METGKEEDLLEKEGKAVGVPPLVPATTKSKGARPGCVTSE